MQAVPINYWAVLVCGVASMLLGALWYGPLFGKMWMNMIGMEEMSREAGSASGGKKTMMKSYAITFVGSLVMAFVLAHSLVFAAAYMKVSGISGGLQAGFWSWLGFVAPVTLGGVLWEGKPWKLWFLTNAHLLVQLLIFGAILGLWK